MPRIDDDDAGTLEVPDIARHHGQAADQRSGGDQGVGLVAPIGDMQMRAARRDLVVDGRMRPENPGRI
ncbi:hypothetical protein L598_000100002250 [Mesorhizobium sp. J18]|nr:hypothetical protein L598_000100002250 [Mesorhizobium sp. J18]